MLFGHHSLRATARITLFFFTWMTLYPTLAAATPPAPASGPAPSLPERNLLDDLRAAALRAKAKAERGEAHEDEAQRLLERAAELDDDAREAEAEFAAVEQHLEAHGLPEEIKQRHRQAVADYRAKLRDLKTRLGEFRNARGRKDRSRAQRALTDLADFLQKEQKTRPQQPFDPKNLPFRTPDDKIRAPKEKKEELDRIIRPQKPVKVAAAELSPGMLAQAEPVPSTAPTPEDVAETEDVSLTPAIRAQAEALHKNPVEIYHFVRNTIEFLPTYGSIQGADLTLQTRRGNAFDTASLLIALLRASNIPARYAYGTIQLPAGEVMNWVGGVTTPEAAQSLLGQGGIPNVALVAGGQIAAFKLEHVWVEAFVDYVPSRGAKHRQGDTWVPLDASFKQYTYTEGLDLKSAVPFDAQGLIDQVQAGATINEAEGWVQNLDQGLIQQALTDYQERIKTYIDSQNPEATVGDVLGIKRIIVQNPPILAGSLPYQTISIARQSAALPDSLRAKYRFTLYTGIDYSPLGGGDVQRGSEVLTYTASLPRLAGGKLTLSFVPATQADTDLINSYLPKPHPDGTPIQPSELPSSLPGYLIHLKAEYRLDGQLVVSGGDFVMGSSYLGSSALYSPDRGWEEAADNVQTAGGYWATYVGATVSQTKLNGLKAELEATKAKLETQQLEGLTKEDFTGDLLFGTILGYFAANDASQRIEQRTVQAVAYRHVSFGHFGVTAKVSYWYGIPRQVAFPSLTMDVDHWRDLVTMKDNNREQRIAYLRQAGARLSAHEHLVPEHLWTDAEHPGEGVSAVKALAKAAAEGQKIYTLTSQNTSPLNQLQIDELARTEIRNALNAGQTVIAHERPISILGWTGSGYIIEDLTSGAGAYKISGGANGGVQSNSYWDRYFAFLNDYLIQLPPEMILSLLFLPGYKAWFGFKPALGSDNPYTTIIHGLSVWLMKKAGFSIPAAGFLGRFLWPIAFFIGIYNFIILLEGFIYAIVRNERNHESYVA